MNVDLYDVIIGYRADDSYFDYADSFLNNAITVNQLSKAMQLGKLGEQVVIKSKFAFEHLKFIQAQNVDCDTYYEKKKNRMIVANNEYTKILQEDTDGLYIQDIIKGNIKNDDARIPRNISK